ncbi:hypothetical protein ACTFIY_012662 [Dictyostelium cf. discoideum]
MDSLSLFLGAKGENKKLVSELSKMVFNSAIDSRIQYSSNEPSIFVDDYFESDNFKKSSGIIKENTKLICNYIKDSIQFSSLRYQAHMAPDPLIPSFIGTIAGYDTSKIPDYFNSLRTFSIKEKVQREFETVYPHGHNTSGGSVSNIEACWSSYWVKFIPVAIKNALLNEIDLIDSKNLRITLVDSKTKKLLIECTNWELSNLSGDLSVKLPYQISLECNLPIENVYEIIKRYHLCSLGTYQFFVDNQTNQPIYLIPASAHYCFKKAVCLIGLGSANIKQIKIEPNGRMNLNEVKTIIKNCIENQIPIINIISILGSTQEYGVDNIDEIVSIRNKVRRDFNFNFEMHVDGIEAGYLTHSIIRPSKIGYGKILKRLFTIGNNPSSDALNYLKTETIDCETGKIKSLDQIVSNKRLLQIISNYGADLNGVCFGFNFISPSTGELNNDYQKYLELNNMIIERFDFSRAPEADLIFGNTFLHNSYGNEFISNFLETNELKINVPTYNKIKIPILRSSTMSSFMSETSEGSYIDIMLDLLLKEITGFIFSINKI